VAATPWPVVWRVPSAFKKALSAGIQLVAVQKGGQTTAVLESAKRSSGLASHGGAGGLVAAAAAAAAALLRSGAAGASQSTAVAQTASRAAAVAARRVPQLIVTWANQNGALRSFTFTLWPLRAAIGAV